MDSERDAMREPLRHFLSSEAGEQIRENLHRNANLSYQAKREAYEYVDFLNVHMCSFGKIDPQNTNHPYYMELFTIVSQHVYGDCAVECLDKAMDIDIEERTDGKR